MFCSTNAGDVVFWGNFSHKIQDGQWKAMNNLITILITVSEIKNGCGSSFVLVLNLVMQGINCLNVLLYMTWTQEHWPPI